MQENKSIGVGYLAAVEPHKGALASKLDKSVKEKRSTWVNLLLQQFQGRPGKQQAAFRRQEAENLVASISAKGASRIGYTRPWG
jgi:hypothetical protein